MQCEFLKQQKEKIEKCQLFSLIYYFYFYFTLYFASKMLYICVCERERKKKLSLGIPPISRTLIL